MNRKSSRSCHLTIFGRILASLSLLLLSVPSLTREANADVVVSCSSFPWSANPNASANICLNCIETEDAVKTIHGGFAYLEATVPNCPNFMITLSGNIRESDFEYFSIVGNRGKGGPKSQEFAFNYEGIGFSLDSLGGDIATALKLGDFLYQQRVAVNVHKCYSACAMVLAGATYRFYFDDTDVRIHRIFPANVGKLSSYESFLKEEGKFYELLALFFRGYGVSSDMVEQMRSVPSSELRSVSVRQLETLGMGPKNARYEDELRFKITQTCGPDEYARYKSEKNNDDRAILKKCAPSLE